MQVECSEFPAERMIELGQEVVIVLKTEFDVTVYGSRFPKPAQSVRDLIEGALIGFDLKINLERKLRESFGGAVESCGGVIVASVASASKCVGKQVEDEIFGGLAGFVGELSAESVVLLQDGREAVAWQGGVEVVGGLEAVVECGGCGMMLEGVPFGIGVGEMFDGDDLAFNGGVRDVLDVRLKSCDRGGGLVVIEQMSGILNGLIGQCVPGVVGWDNGFGT